MSNSKHFKALCRKNAITWKRAWLTSLLEILMPVLCMGGVSLLRYFGNKVVSKETDFLHYGVAQFPEMYLEGKYEWKHIRGKGGKKNTKLEKDMEDFLDFAGIPDDPENAYRRSPLDFFPPHCYNYRKPTRMNQDLGPDENGQAKNRNATAIGYVVDNNRVESAFVTQFKLLQQIQQNHEREGGAPPGTYHKFELIPFERKEIMEMYLNDTEYGYDDNKPQLCFAFEIKKYSDQRWEVRMHYNDQIDRDYYGSGVPKQNLPSWSPIRNSADLSSFDKYMFGGYSMFQNWIANTILKQRINKRGSIAMVVIPAKTPAYDYDPLMKQILAEQLPLFTVLMYIVPVFRFSYRMVAEKEQRSRESMQMMGLTEFAYWSSWLIYYLVTNTFISLLSTIILSTTLLKFSSAWLVFSYFWLYGLSLFGYILICQSFFERARYAGGFAVVLHVALSFGYLLVETPDTPEYLKMWASLIPQITIRLLSVPFAGFESVGIGLNSSNVDMLFQNYKFEKGMNMLVLDFFIYSLLGIYIDNIIPRNFGQRRSCLYPCKRVTPTYWDCFEICRRETDIDREEMNRLKVEYEAAEQQKKMHIQNNQLDLQEGDLGPEISLEDLENFETKYLLKEKFEPPSQALLDLEQKHKFLKITDLFKVYDNGFRAVNGINVRIYEGQIFALLGHNGAGKTTTISMLTGMLQPTKGAAEIFNQNLFSGGLDYVRKYMGVCPQHDILFDLLTPWEHLSVFIDFKGAEEVNHQGPWWKKILKNLVCAETPQKQDEIQKLLKDVGLWEYRDTVAKNLSGGSKRKLSVAIALCGNSKFVLLDEPTAGMDLQARRSLWNMLRLYRRDKVIILTTHYMDEADVLGDRIGIMVNGKLVCLGSSLFLKKKFGYGYNLTIVKTDKDDDTVDGRVRPFMIQHLGENVQKQSEIAREITYQISMDSASKFKEFFEAFDLKREELGIASYGISITTLEEVFLKVGGHIDQTAAIEQQLADEKAEQAKKAIEAWAEKEKALSVKLPAIDIENRNRLNSEASQEWGLEGGEGEGEPKGPASDAKSQHYDKNVEEEGASLMDKAIEAEYDAEIEQYSIADKSNAGCFNSAGATTKKRTVLYCRAWLQLIFEIAVPVILVTIGFTMTKVQFFFDSDPRWLQTKLYPLRQRILMNEQAVQIEANQDVYWSTFIQSFEDDPRTKDELISKLFPLKGARGASTIPEGALLSSYINATNFKTFSQYLPKDTIKSLYSNLPSSYTLPTDDDFDVKYVNYTDAYQKSSINDKICKDTQAKNKTFECEIVNFDLVSRFDHDFYKMREEPPVFPNKLAGSFGSYLVYEANKLNQQYKVVTYVNTTSQDAAAAYPQFMYESILRTASGNPNFQFKFYTEPFPILQKYKDKDKVASNQALILVLAVGLSIIPASIIGGILYEREQKLKHLQVISGMNLFSYWLVNLLFDIIKTLFPIGLIILIMYFFDLKDFYQIIPIFLLFPIAVVPFTYGSSFLFTTEITAQGITVFFNLLSMSVLPLLIFQLKTSENYSHLGDKYGFYARIFPAYSLSNALLFAGSGKQIAKVRQEFLESGKVMKSSDDGSIFAPYYYSVEPWSFANLGGDFWAMILHGCFGLVLILLFEGVFCQGCWDRVFMRLFRKFFKNTQLREQSLAQNEKIDEDVVAEEVRVAAAQQGQLQVKVDKFRKVYQQTTCKQIVAVDGASFGLDHGDCFTLLGVNGAGKTTTFKSLTNDIIPTTGSVSIGDYDVQAQFSKVRQLIGYCPQENIVFDQLTVEEHLDFYVRIKGIPKNLRKRIIDRTIKRLQLEEQKTKEAHTLSGGNKRKLQVAIAIIGNPRIILLDEPSAGMDPEARRFMWSVVKELSGRKDDTINTTMEAKSSHKSTVILTTHSMEEAEALSTKMGIMVTGGVLRCFGSVQHIKDKYATGYEIEFKIGKMSQVRRKDKMVEYGLPAHLQMISLDECCEVLREGPYPLLADQLTVDGLGNALYRESMDNELREVSMQTFVEWIHTFEFGTKTISDLVDDFGFVELIEQHSDKFLVKVMRQNKTIGSLFGFMESNKEIFGTQEYSVSQTTLEQIFQKFAGIDMRAGLDKGNLVFEMEKGALKKLKCTRKNTTELIETAIKTAIAHNMNRSKRRSSQHLKGKADTSATQNDEPVLLDGRGRGEEIVNRPQTQSGVEMKTLNVVREVIQEESINDESSYRVQSSIKQSHDFELGFSSHPVAQDLNESVKSPSAKPVSSQSKRSTNKISPEVVPEEVGEQKSDEDEEQWPQLQQEESQPGFQLQSDLEDNEQPRPDQQIESDQIISSQQPESRMTNSRGSQRAKKKKKVKKDGEKRKVEKKVDYPTGVKFMKN